MSIIDVAPRVFKNMGVQIAGRSFERAINKLQFIPEVTLSRWRGGRPDAVFTDVNVVGWTCAMSLAQDWWSGPETLSRFLLEHGGEGQDAEFRIDGAAHGPLVKARLVLATPPYGGDIDAWLAADVTHGVAGQPQFLDDTGAGS